MNNQKETIRTYLNFRNLTIRILCGIREMVNNPLKLIIAFMYVGVSLIEGTEIISCYSQLNEMKLTEQIDLYLGTVFCFILMTSCFLIFLYACSKPILAWKWQKNLIRAGVTNSMGEVPILIEIQKKRKKDYCVIELLFDTCGVPLNVWVDKQLLLENALNISISQIKQGRNKRQIIIRAVSGNYHYP